jgi:hypothetical protein
MLMATDELHVVRNHSSTHIDAFCRNPLPSRFSYAPQGRECCADTLLLSEGVIRQDKQTGMLELSSSGCRELNLPPPDHQRQHHRSLAFNLPPQLTSTTTTLSSFKVESVSTIVLLHADYLPTYRTSTRSSQPWPRATGVQAKRG